MSRPSTMASMLSGTSLTGSSAMCAADDIGRSDGVSVAFVDLSCRLRWLTSGMGAAVSDSSSSDESESVADCNDWAGEAYRQ